MKRNLLRASALGLLVSSAVAVAGFAVPAHAAATPPDQTASVTSAPATASDQTRPADEWYTYHSTWGDWESCESRGWDSGDQWDGFYCDVGQNGVDLWVMYN